MVVDTSSDDQLEYSKKGKPNKTVLPVMSKNAMVIDSSSDLDDQVRKKGKPNKKVLAASLDSDIEEIPNPKENSEEELGECYLM